MKTQVIATLALIAGAVGCTALPPAAIDVRTGSPTDQFAVRFDPQLGTPASLVNRSLQDTPGARGTRPVTPQAADSSVRALVADRPTWFRLRPGLDDFRRVRSEVRGWLCSLWLVQTYRGVPVVGAGYEARVLADGRIGSLEGSLHPDLNLDVRPVLSESQAENRARESFPPGQPAPRLPIYTFESQYQFPESRLLVIIPDGTRYALAWGVMVQLVGSEYARVYVDAANGALLGMQRIGWSVMR